jgi:putative membrane protein
MKHQQWIVAALTVLAFVFGLLAGTQGSASWMVGAVALLLFALPAFMGVIEEKKQRGVLIILVLGIFAYIVESIAVRFGFPYGYFFYSEGMGPSPVGLAPLVVSLAFAPLALGAIALATRLKLKDFTWIFGIAGILVLIDLVIDPGAIAEGLWNFRNGGFLYGMPLSNILGWLFTGSLVGFVLREPILSKKPVYGLLFILAFWTAVALTHVLIIPALLGLALIGATTKILTQKV